MIQDSDRPQPAKGQKESSWLACSWWLRWRRIRVAVRAGSPLQLGIPIKAISSPTLLEPGFFGVFRPVLLLPEGIFERLTPAQLRGVIAHELCHVQHRDNLIAAIHMFVETAFWFHPLVWWIGRRMVEEREQACDEEVLRLGSEPRVYAGGILNVCKFYLESPLVCASGVTGADLKRRIEFITSNRVMHNLNVGRRMLLLTASVVALGLPITIGIVHPSQGRAQSTAPRTPPSFEVASIKPSMVPEGSSTWDSSPAGSLRMKNQTLRACIRIAFGVKDNQISGGPKWLDSDRYNIDAKAATPAKDPQLLLMLQALLADRFKLSFHKETRESPGLVLVVAKNGLKIKPVQPSQNNQLNTRGGHMIAKGVSLAKLAQMLSNLMSSPVLDDTHVASVFDFTLDWTLDASLASGPPTASPAEEAQRNPLPTSNTASVAADPSVGVSLLSALQDALGLKLEARKIPTEVLVIDHAEKPSEN